MQSQEIAAPTGKQDTDSSRARQNWARWTHDARRSRQSTLCSAFFIGDPRSSVLNPADHVKNFLTGSQTATELFAMLG